jgi:hypothetical protein
MASFLRILLLLSRYDEITRTHLTEVVRSHLEDEAMKRKALYLSWMSQNEFICIGGDKMLRHILEEG